MAWWRPIERLRNPPPPTATVLGGWQHATHLYSYTRTTSPPPYSPTVALLFRLTQLLPQRPSLPLPSYT